MTKLTNKSEGVRTVNVREGEDVVSVVPIAPGETVDVELVNAEDPSYQGYLNSGDLVEGDEEELSEEEQKKKDEAKYYNDPGFVLNRALAEQAGHELADPLPEDTDTEGGSESQEALERQGIQSEEDKPKVKRVRPQQQRAPETE